MRLLAALVALACATAAAGSPAEAQEPQKVPAPVAAAPEIEAAVRALVSDRAFKDAKVGISIVDVESGRVLAASGEHVPLNPASNAKVYTAAAALATLRGDFRYETTLSGVLKSGEVTGALVLRGSGDPSLQTSDLVRMVDDLREPRRSARRRWHRRRPAGLRRRIRASRI
ncbi:MAG: D-alanyl-D-alanine carboxypeptidase [Myxococcales bacterium]|nr:D-alanyl-D-alanine carboxypeptidase [Myxococcales bacterium]